jgi:Xaa-Pro dipeptidase
LLAGEKATLLKDSDQLVPFRQRRYFYYLTGCNESDCYVTYNIADDLLTLYIPKVDLRHAVWGGAGSTKIEAFAKYDVDAVEYTSELRKMLFSVMNSSQATRIYLRDNSDIDGVVPAEVSWWALRVSEG